MPGKRGPTPGPSDSPCGAARPSPCCPAAPPPLPRRSALVRTCGCRFRWARPWLETRGRGKTPKRRTWAARLAVMGLAALLLPLAPSWAQKDTTESPPAQPDRVTPASNAKLRASWNEELETVANEIEDKQTALTNLV